MIIEGRGRKGVRRKRVSGRGMTMREGYMRYMGRASVHCIDWCISYYYSIATDLQ